MIAYVDESLRQSGGGLYLVAAVVIAGEENHLEQLRHEVDHVKLAREASFHWRNEADPQRFAMLAWIAGAKLPVRAYVHRPTLPRHQARARAQCLKALLWDAKELGVKELVLESRQPHNDQKDRQSIVWAQKAGVAAAELRYGFARPREEPLLWAADAMAGAVSAAAAQETDRYILALPPGQVVVKDVEP